MGFLRNLIWVIKETSRADSPTPLDAADDRATVADLPCRAPNMTDNLTSAGAAQEDPATVRARIMETRGVSERCIVLNTERCTLCGHCVEVCPDGATTVGEAKVIDSDLCTTCACCVTSCPQEALEIQETPL